jgi:hypothetical protein
MSCGTAYELAERNNEVPSVTLVTRLYPLLKRTPDHTVVDVAERDKNEFTQLSDTNKAVVFFIIELAMAVMSNINVLSSIYSVGDPQPGGEGPYGGSRA